MEMSSHLFPEVSAHLLAATPTCHWLEFVDWAGPILTQPLQVRDGMVAPPEKLLWDESAVARYAL
jgi:mandelate racemase